MAATESALTQQLVRADADDDLFPDAWITAGEALDTALRSLNLDLVEPARPRPAARLFQTVILGLAAFVAVCASLTFFLWTLSLFGRPA